VEREDSEQRDRRTVKRTRNEMRTGRVEEEDLSIRTVERSIRKISIAKSKAEGKITRLKKSSP